MKKIQVLIISILFLFSNSNVYSFLKTYNPYSIGPEGRAMSDLKNFSTPAQIANILPNRPVSSTDSSGTRVYYSPSGRQMFSVSKDGQTTMSAGNVTTTRDKEGNIISISERKKGTSIVEMKDSFGELIGYKTVKANGLTDKEFDSDFNLVRSYNYDKFNKTLTSVVDEVTQEKTLYDEFGREKGVVSLGFGGDGAVISTCQYDDVSYERSEDGKSIIEVVNDSKYADAKLLVTKKTYCSNAESFNSDGSVNVSSGYNTIYYDREGLISKVVDNNGITISEYFYKRDNYGNKVLTHVLNPKDKSITYYENGKAIEERNDMGAVTKKYYYDGSRLLYTVSMNSDSNFGEVTYYNKAGKAIATTYKYIEYDPSSSERVDFVCGSEYSVKLNEDQIKEIKDGKSSLVKGKDYIIKTEKNPNTQELEDIYYLVPDGIEGVNYIRKEVKNKDGEMEIKFLMITEKYVYDEKGNIDYVINLGDNTRTYYKNNKMYYTAANDDSTKGIKVSDNPNDPRLLKVFVWDVDLDWEDENKKASVLRYVFDTKTQTTQWFNANSQFVYLTYNDRLISSNIYDGARLAGTWNNQTKELTILRDEKQWITVKLDSEPDVSFIRKVLSFTNGDSTDWTLNSYISYYAFREKLLKDNYNLVEQINTFEKYNKLKADFIGENSEFNEAAFIEYLKGKLNQVRTNS